MLSETSIKSAYNLAAIVSRKGKVLRVKEGSALADLLVVCDPLDAGFEGLETEVKPAEVLVTESVATADHQSEVERLVDLAAKATAYTMDVARNKVTPKVKAIVENTEAHIDASRWKRLEPLLIEPQFIAPVYESAELHDLIAKHAKADHRDIAPVALTAVYGPNALTSGIPSFDGVVAHHFDGREETVKSLWTRYFSSQPGVYRAKDWREDLQTVDDALVVFLGAHALLESEEVPEGLSMSLPAYRAYLAVLEEQAASHLAYLLDKAKIAIKAKQLVIQAPLQNRPGDPIKGIIKVHGPVYNQWLAEGGSPEALCGAIAQGASKDYTALLEQADSHVAAWQRMLNVLQAQASFELHATTIHGLKLAFLAAAAGVPEDERVFEAGELDAVLEQRLAKLTDGALENLYTVAQDLVCDLLYPQTDAKAFLIALNKAAEERTGMDIKEIALVVAIDYITGWVSEAISVDDANLSDGE